MRRKVKKKMFKTSKAIEKFIKKEKAKKKKKEFNVNGDLFGAARKIDRWHPGRKEALKLAQTSEGFYVCCMCGDRFTRDRVHVDHIDPVVDPATGFTTWDNYYRRLFVPVDKRQVICKTDHKTKTNLENKKRRR